MADITVTYEGNTIATMSASGTKTFYTAGKYCDDDITLTYVQPSGGGSSVDRGTFTPESNQLSVDLPVTHTITGVVIIAESSPYSAGSGVRCLSGCVYDSFGSVVKINLGSNNAGTSGSLNYNSPDLSVSQSGNTLTVSSANTGSNGYFIAGITYRWIAW